MPYPQQRLGSHSTIFRHLDSDLSGSLLKGRTAEDRFRWERLQARASTTRTTPALYHPPQIHPELSYIALISLQQAVSRGNFREGGMEGGVVWVAAKALNLRCHSRNHCTYIYIYTHIYIYMYIYIYMRTPNKEVPQSW